MFMLSRVPLQRPSKSLRISAMPGDPGSPPSPPDLPRNNEAAMVFHSFVAEKRRASLDTRIARFKWSNPKTSTPGMTPGTSGESPEKRKRTSHPDEKSVSQRSEIKSFLRSSHIAHHTFSSSTPIPARRESAPSSTRSPPPDVIVDGEVASTSMPSITTDPIKQLVLVVPKDYSPCFVPMNQCQFQQPTPPSSESIQSVFPSPPSEFEKVKQRLFRQRHTEPMVIQNDVLQQDKADLEYFVKHFLGEGYIINKSG